MPNDFCALTSVAALLRSDIFTVDRWRAGSHCFAGSPGNPVAHQTVWRIIAEAALEFPRVASLELYGPGAPDSVRCAKNQHNQVLFFSK
jgi:hypothetical protein